MPENTLVNQVKIWANDAFAKKVDFTWASRGVQDRFRPLMLDANGNLDSSAIEPSPVFSGTLGVYGARKVRINANAGTYGVQINSAEAGGGWASAYSVTKADWTKLGGFGALGSADTLTHLYVGPEYNSYWQNWTAALSTINTALSVISNGAAFSLVGTDQVYQGWFPAGTAAGRKAYMGFGSSGSTTLSIANEYSGIISFIAGGAQRATISTAGEVAAATFQATAGSWGSGYQFSAGSGSLFGASTYIGMQGAGANGVFISRTDAFPSYISLGIANTNDQNASLNLMTNGAASTTATLILERLAGVNGNGELRHYGTGSFTVNTVNAAILYLATSNTVRMTFSAAGLVGIGVAPSTQQLKVLGSVAVGGDQGGTAAYTTFTNVWNETISTGVGSIKMCGTTARTNTGFLKLFNGTAARYVPTFTTITG